MSSTILEVKELRFLDKGPYSFSIADGESLGLRGRSGIGKTQLFRAITDLVPATGEILLEGVSYRQIAPVKYRSQVTLIPADSSWWYDRVGDHFTVSSQLAMIHESLNALGLPEEVLDWQVSHLSTGERQRLALIRGLRNRPVVLLLDEPSSGLDSYHTQLLETFVDQYRHQNGTAIVWVSHDSDQLERVADRTLRMENDRLIEQ